MGRLLKDSQVHKEIALYIDQLCRSMNEPQQAVEDFREEMTANLLSSVEELIAQGYTDQDALRMALERFGEPREIERELKELYRMQRMFAKGVFKSAMILLILGTLIASMVPIWNNGLYYVFVKQAIHDVRQHVGTADQPITEAMLSGIKRRVDWNPMIDAASIRVRSMKDMPMKSQIQFLYPADTPVDDSYGNLERRERTLTYSPEIGSGTAIMSTGEMIDFTMSVKKLTDTTFMIGIALIFGYWALFAVWASINAYSNRHKQIVWVAMFICFNVLGYGLYRLAVQRAVPVLALK